MAFWDNLLPRRTQAAAPTQSVDQQQAINASAAVGATGQIDITTLQSFDNSNITFSSDLACADYDRILRDKQGHINQLYELSDYYTDADAICAAIIKQVYMPYATGARYYLTGNPKTIKIYEQYYKTIRLREKIDDIMLNYFKYANVFIYIWKGNVMVLPPHKCVIGNISLNGTPTVFYDVQSIINEYKYKTFSYLSSGDLNDDDMQKLYEGYPPEIARAVAKGQQRAQLTNENVFVLQGPKQGWTRYSIPWVAAALTALAKKELIGKWENSMLNLSERSFVHVRYGDQKHDTLPDIGQLRAVRNVFSSAMSGNPLAVTNQLAKAEVITTDISKLYQWPLYQRVNADIMSAGGIAGILATGQSEDGSTFASAQVSIQTATSRIEAARREVEDFMNKLNKRLVEDISEFHRNNLKEVPEFHFAPFDISGKKAMLETCQSLWTDGVVSTRTFMEMNGYSLEQEVARRKEQASNGTDQVLMNRAAQMYSAQASTQPTQKQNPGGRPKLDDDERNSDPQSSVRSKQTKQVKDGDIPEQNDVS